CRVRCRQYLIGGAHERLDIVRREGLADQITLREVAAELPQQAPGLGLLDSLGDDAQAHAVPQADGRSDDGRLIAAEARMRDERAIDLQLIDRQTAQLRERRMPGTEIVDRETHAR